MKFKKGQSGNPAGRKAGESHAAKLRKAIEDDLPDIIASMVSAAKSGDTAAAKLLLDRSIPALKPQQQAVPLSGLSGASPTDQGVAVLSSLGEGELSIEEAQGVLASIASLVKLKEMDELEIRLNTLEGKLK